MAARGKKRVRYSSSSDSASSKRRQVQVSTFEKWLKELDKEHSTLHWLQCDRDRADRSLLSTLWCKVCREYESKIVGMRNFSSAWISGSSNHRTSNIVDHANSAQHQAAMNLMRTATAKAHNQPIQSYAPVARALLTIDDAEKARMMKKFDVCYVLAREGIAFRKYPPICALEKRHGIELGTAYMWPDSAKIFTHYIAESQRQDFFHTLAQSTISNFFSFLMDGSTDSGNLEVELVLVVFCMKNDTAREIQACTRYLATVKPAQANADGLLASVDEALSRLGIEDIHSQTSVLDVADMPVLIGAGTDGASVNVGAHSGMKAKLQADIPWLFWSWCFAHRLELACKEAFISPLFSSIDEMLLRLYYLYEKSPKKSQELRNIVDDLKEVFCLPNGGSLPIRCQGTRWITHKRKALQRVIDRYGAYIAHLTTLSQDTSIKSVDRARLQGYLKDWSKAKMLVGCAMYVEILKIPSILSLTLQYESLDIVGGINSLVKSINTLLSLTKQNPLQWPQVKLLVTKVTDDGDSQVYQGCALTEYSDNVLQQCSAHAKSDLNRLDVKLRERLQWSDMKLLRSILVFLDTRSWIVCPCSSNTSDESELDVEQDFEQIISATDYIISLFRVPLEAKQASLSSFSDELEEAVTFARKYVSLSTEDYKKVWYKLHVSPDSKHWPNVLLLSELLFSLPFTTSCVERAFSKLNVIRTDRRNSLQVSTVDDLMEINIEGPAYETFSSSSAVSLWWTDRTRRPNQKPPRESGPAEPENDEGNSQPKPIALDLWDQLFTE